MAGKVILGKKTIRLDPNKSIGTGGEAEVYDIGNGLALKIFKAPDHPDFRGKPEEQKGAALKILEHQEKLRLFPQNLPSGVIKPEELAYNLDQTQIVGYAMQFVTDADLLIRFSERDFRKKGVTSEKTVAILRYLHNLVAAVHRSQAIIGDFNDLNVLVRYDRIFLIDADSFQFGKFLSWTFTERFVDPLLCGIEKNNLMLKKAYSAESDWYAFAIMVMQCLLFVGPYGGVYRPKNPAQNFPHHLRPLQRITVFRPEVIYPKPAAPRQILPDTLLQYFHQVFEKDQRGIFPEKLLATLEWKKCDACQTEHARGVCPQCSPISPAAIKELVTVRGKVISSLIFKTRGVILSATSGQGQLQWLYHENKQYKRENGEAVLTGYLDPRMRFRLLGKRTLIGKDGHVVTLQKGLPPEQLSVDSFRNLPIFDTNDSNRFWCQNGQLFRDAQLGPKYVGVVLAGQTLFWVGPRFGLGFWRAGSLSAVFVFDAVRAGINDRVKIPKFSGQMIDATCVFSETLAWFFLAIQDRGKIIHKAIVVSREGAVVAQYEAEKNDGGWLWAIRGKCAAGNFLFAATDDGIVRLEPDSGTVANTREFPDTEPFVNSVSQLFTGKEGLWVVDRREIRLLKIG